MASKRANKVLNATRSKPIKMPSDTPLGSPGYDNIRDDIEKTKALREGSIVKTPTDNLDIVNKLYVDNQDNTKLDLDGGNANTTINIQGENLIGVGDLNSSGTIIHTGTWQCDNIRISTNKIESDTGTITMVNDHLTTTGDVSSDNLLLTGNITSTNSTLTITGASGSGEFQLISNGGDITCNKALEVTNKIYASGANDLELQNSDILVKSFGHWCNENSGYFLNNGGAGGNAGYWLDGSNARYTNRHSNGEHHFYANTATAGGGGEVSVMDITDTEVEFKKEIFSTKFKITPEGAYCISLTNKTGANSVQGELVVTHTTIDDAVALSGTSDLSVIGVFLESSVSDGSEAWVVVSGIAPVHMDANAVVRGDRIVSSTATAGRGAANNAPSAAAHFTEIGHCIQSGAANSTVRCVLHFL